MGKYLCLMMSIFSLHSGSPDVLMVTRDEPIAAFIDIFDILERPSFTNIFKAVHTSTQSCISEYLGLHKLI